VFVNGTESFVKLTMEIRDGGGNVISRTTGLEVPYRRGHLTTVRARFLTNEMQGGVEIDPGFDGDIDVDLDGLI
jgi:conserved domain protein